MGEILDFLIIFKQGNDVETKLSSYVIPPSTSLLLPANMQHSIYMEGPVAMWSLFLQGSAADRIYKKSKVIAVTS